MKICHITTAHPPFDVRIYLKECQTLAQAGFETFLVAQDIEIRHKSDGIMMIPLPTRRGRPGRIFSALFEAPFTACATGADIFHFHDPELIPSGIFLKLLGKKVIYDVHEDYAAATQTREWIPLAVRWPIAAMFRAAEIFGGFFFDSIVAATPFIASKMPAHKTTVVQNFPLRDEFSHTVPTNRSEHAKPYVTYMGPCVRERGVEDMVQAMGCLPSQSPLRLKLAGVASPDLIARLKNLKGWERVDMLGLITRDEVATLLSEAIAGLVIFHPIPNHINSQPNKLFEYMSSELPVIGSNFPLWKNIIEGSGCGLCVDPNSPQEIAQAIEWLFANPEKASEMGRRGRIAVEKKYNWEAEAPNLVNLYKKIASSVQKRKI